MNHISCTEDRTSKVSYNLLTRVLKMDRIHLNFMQLNDAQLTILILHAAEQWLTLSHTLGY